jgi:hypothetical protein
VTYADLGSAVTFHNAGVDVIATLNTVGGEGYYTAVTPNPALAETTWDVTTQGGDFVEPQTWTGLISVPGDAVILTPAGGAILTIPTSGGALDVTWTPMGADIARVSVRSIGVFYSVHCFAQDDGAFAIPADVMAGLSTNARITLTGIREEFREEGGKRIGFQGYSIISKRLLKQ